MKIDLRGRVYSKRKKLEWQEQSLFQIFLFPLFLREIRSNTFLKNNPTPRGTQLFRSYFLYSHDGMSDQNRWHSRKASKIKAFSGFWGRFSKPQKIQFYRWHSVFGVKKTILRQWDEKNLTAFFRFWKSTKSGFKKITIFWNKFEVCEKEINFILKETVSLLIQFEIYFLKERRNSNITKKFILWKPTKLSNLQKMKKGMRMKENEIKALKVKPHEHPEV